MLPDCTGDGIDAVSKLSGLPALADAAPALLPWSSSTRTVEAQGVATKAVTCALLFVSCQSPNFALSYEATSSWPEFGFAKTFFLVSI
jgi:hypothetical protein